MRNHRYPALWSAYRFHMVSWDMVRHHALVCKAGGLHIWDLVEEPLS